MLRIRRLALPFGLVGIVGLLAASSAVASASVAEVGTVETPAGRQIVVHLHGSVLLVRAYGDGILLQENTGYTIAIAPGAVGCTQIKASQISCSGDGLLTATPTVKPLVFETTSPGGDADAAESPFPVDIEGSLEGSNVHGSQFDDIIHGGDGKDYLDGEAGNDLVDGGPGDDSLFGNAGDDVVEGGEGGDRLEGDTGRDTLSGGAGDDLVMAEANYDQTWFGSDFKRLEDPFVPANFTVDAPADCGAGDDSFVRASPEADPVLPGCEHDIAEPVAPAPTIRGTLAVGSVLTAAILGGGEEPGFRQYMWSSCKSIDDHGRVSLCTGQSFCQNYRLTAADLGNQIAVYERETYTLGGGRYKVQPDDAFTWTDLRVAADQPAGPVPGPPMREADLGRFYYGYGQVWVEGLTGRDATGATIHDPATTDEHCADLKPDGEPRTAPTSTENPSEARSVTPQAAQPVPSVSAEPAPGGALAAATPARAAVPGTTTASDPHALATRAARALGTTRSRVLLSRHVWTLSATTTRATTIRLQVRGGGTWQTVAIGRAVASARPAKVAVQLGPVGRSRLASSLGGHRSVKVRVVVQVAGAGNATASATLAR